MSRKDNPFPPRSSSESLNHPVYVSLPLCFVLALARVTLCPFSLQAAEEGA